MLFKHLFDDISLKHMINKTPFETTSFFYNHYHEDEYELLFFLQGSAQLMVDNSLHSLTPQSLIIFKPNVMHQILVNSRLSYERIVINIKVSALPEHLEKAMRELDLVYSISGTEIEKIFARIDNHCRLFSEGDVLHTLVKGTVTEGLSYLCFGEKPDANTLEVSRNLTRIIDYIQENATTIKTIEELAKNVNLSKSTIYKEFDNHLHISPMTFIRMKKCMLAKHLIHKGENVTNVYEQCGFSEYSSFYRAYKATFGCPPSKEVAINIDSTSDELKTHLLDNLN